MTDNSVQVTDNCSEMIDNQRESVIFGFSRMRFFDLFEISSKSTWKYSRMELIGLENLKGGLRMILSVKDVYKSYGKEQVLRGITFEIEEPQIIALVGPNGSGKSTLMNIITNLLPADKGKVTVLGKNNRDPNIFREISFMQDNTVLYDYLTGYDHMQFICDVQGLSKK